MPATLEASARWEQVQERAAAIRKETARVIVGQEEIVEQLLTSLLCKGHCLLVGVPGLAMRPLKSRLTFDVNAMILKDRPPSALGTAFLKALARTIDALSRPT